MLSPLIGVNGYGGKPFIAYNGYSEALTSGTLPDYYSTPTTISQLYNVNESAAITMTVIATSTNWETGYFGFGTKNWAGNVGTSTTPYGYTWVTVPSAELAVGARIVFQFYAHNNGSTGYQIFYRNRVDGN